MPPSPSWDALSVPTLTPSSRLAGAVLDPVRSWTRNSVQSLYFSLMAAKRHTEKEKHTNNQCVKRAHSGGVVSWWIINCAPLLIESPESGMQESLHACANTDTQHFVGIPSSSLSSFGREYSDWVFNWLQMWSILTMNSIIFMQTTRQKYSGLYSWKKSLWSLNRRIHAANINAQLRFMDEISGFF